MRGYRSYIALLIGLFAVVASATASGQVRESAHTVTSRGNVFLLDGQPSFLVLGQARNCPPQSSGGWDSLVGQMASAGVMILQGRQTACGIDASSLDQALASHDMMWLEQGSVPAQATPVSERVDWQAPFKVMWASFRCDTHSSAASYAQISAAAKSGPVVAYVQVGAASGTSTACNGPAGVANSYNTALAAGAAAVYLVTINPHDATAGSGYSVPDGNLETAQQQERSSRAFVEARLHGQALQVKVPSAQPIRASAWKYNGKVMLLAYNTSDKPAKAQINVPALGKAKGVFSLSLSSTARRMIVAKSP